MLFPSEIFLFVFLPAVLFLYYVPLRKTKTLKNIFLFLASLFFYAWGELDHVFLLLLVIGLSYLSGILIDRLRGKKNAVKLVLALMICINIGILGWFKYSTFILNQLNIHLHTHFSLPLVTLPIGISFFTFQAMSYVFDIYRKQGPVQKNPLHVGLYISLFPQLIAGPIVRYETIAAQIEDRSETFEDFSAGVARFCIGLGKKVLVSNNLALVADNAFRMISADHYAASTATAWLGAVSYTLQIFFDFSGYSDMAIGLGQMFGFHFEENFRYPYISATISEFWRRWHISLQTWFRDYVYFPLGGSRVSTPRLVFNLFVVWSLTGIWHGASWTFAAWGLLYFVLLTFEKLTRLNKKRFVGLQEIFEQIYGNGIPADSSCFHLEAENHPGDLAVLTGVPERFALNAYYVPNTDFADPAQYHDQTLLIIGDSFGEDLGEIAKSYYSQVCYVPFSDFRTVSMADYSPDLVIWECVERYADNLKDLRLMEQ